MKRICSLLVIILLLCIHGKVKADVAPPQQPPGANPDSGAEMTQVRMDSEQVVLEIEPTAPNGSLGQANVTATFEMHNTGSSAEFMKVRFPISADNGFFQQPKISNFVVYVKGQMVDADLTTGPDPYHISDSVPWREFPVTFPAGEIVEIKVTYTLEASGYDTSQVWFSYVFSTGAGWKDSIGQADLIVRLPYDVTPENYITNDDPQYSPTTPGGIISGDEIHWKYTNLEPTSADNFKVTVVSPQLWSQLLKDKRDVEKYPNDSEIWGTMGKDFKQLLIGPKGRGFRTYAYASDPGAQMVFADSKLGYDKAVSLKQDDPLWHAGYAELLGYYAYWAAMEGNDTRVEETRALGEIQKALTLAPTDATVLQIAAELSGEFPAGMVQNGGSYDFPGLTATPSSPTAEGATPTIDARRPTETRAAAGVTPAPTKLPGITLTPSNTKKPLLPFCGSLLLVPAALLIAWKMTRK